MIYPPEESHRRGIPVVVALETRIARCRWQIDLAKRQGQSAQVLYSHGQLEAFQDALELVELTQQTTAGVERRRATAQP